MNRVGLEPTHLSILECTSRVEEGVHLLFLESSALDRSAIDPVMKMVEKRHNIPSEQRASSAKGSAEKGSILPFIHQSSTLELQTCLV
jgi:hypothetical protein